ncbi:MAG: transcription termination/antitermination protein NusG [Alphaproteobacteria bacterium]|nr:transcription termination/antitermination protein NusG [Alphaproteobacteria bacterium]MBE8220920.1 transcription termination/antitermination protein NusG [Alphaproteobacteria bacterium]
MEKQWYIVHAYSNFEHKVAESLLEQAAQAGIADCFEEIVVPTENVVEMRRGKRVNSERKLFPGYVLVRMNMTDAAFVLVKNTPKVTGFLGSQSKPAPLSQAEVDAIMNQAQDGTAARPAVVFEIGEQVRVREGPFASFSGHVEAIDEEKARLKVAVSIFGRATPVELEYGQVEKL